MISKSMLEGICFDLLDMSAAATSAVASMSEEGWHQFDVMIKNVEAMDVERNGIESLRQYGLELSKQAFAKNTYESILIQQLNESANKRYESSKDPTDLELTLWHRNLAKYMSNNRDMYERLKNTLDQRMEKAIAEDKLDKPEGYASGILDTVINRKKLVKSILGDKLSKLGYQHSKTASGKYFLAFENKLDDDLSIYFSVGTEGLKRKTDEVREAFNSIALFIAEPGIELDGLRQNVNYLRFDFQAIFTLYPTSYYAPYLRFADVLELEVNLLAMARLYEHIHYDFIKRVKKGFSKNID